MKIWQRIWRRGKRWKKYLAGKLNRKVIFHWWVRIVLSWVSGAVVYEILFTNEDARLFLAVMAGGVTFLLFSWWLLIPAVPLLAYVMLELMFTDAESYGGILRVIYPVVVCSMLIGVPPLLGAWFHYRKLLHRKEQDPLR
ncbi:MAG TPA: hypothetical protein PLO53_14060 [Candidatus Hydrogenedentes bacterium]|nr:hypothetical protein [Candidatus Hydrogenedentota bacterium]